MTNYKIFLAIFMMLLGASCSKDKLYTYPASLSDKTKITAIRLLNEAGEDVISTYEIDDEKSTVSIKVNADMPLNKLFPTAMVSEGVIVEPIMGVYTDFSSPVNYTLIAGDRTTTRNWTFVVSH